MTSPEKLLTEVLHERADHRVLPSTPMGAVVTHARRIRLRRRLRYGLVATAVVAVLATPFVIDAAHRGGTGPVPSKPSSTDAAPQVRLADVALGDPPAVAWIDGSDYVAADGTRTTLPVDQVRSATPYAGGFLVAEYGDRDLTLLDSRLREVWRHCSHLPQLAVDQAGLRTAYATSGCDRSTGTLHFGPTDGTDERTAPITSVTGIGAAPVGFIRTAVVLSSTNQRPPALVDTDGTMTTIDSLMFVSGVDGRQGTVSGQLAGVRSGQTTGAVVDPRTNVVKWRAPGWALDEFSPDGSMVVGRQIGVEGAGLAIFDAETGQQLHQFAMPQSFLSLQVSWEDDEHLLLPTIQRHTQAILRTTLDGAIQRATEVAPYGPDEGSGLRFGLAPNLVS